MIGKAELKFWRPAIRLIMALTVQSGQSLAPAAGSVVWGRVPVGRDDRADVPVREPAS